MLLLHITIALLSVAYATYLFAAPAAAKFVAHYILIGTTVVTGTALLVQHPAHMAETCTMGLLYTGAISILTVAARRKLAHQHIQTRAKQDV